MHCEVEALEARLAGRQVSLHPLGEWPFQLTVDERVEIPLVAEVVEMRHAAWNPGHRVILPGNGRPATRGS
jgi:hypothetical protein